MTRPRIQTPLDALNLPPRTLEQVAEEMRASIQFFSGQPTIVHTLREMLADLEDEIEARARHA